MDKNLQVALEWLKPHFEPRPRVYRLPETLSNKFNDLYERVYRMEQEVFGIQECGCPQTSHDCDNCSACGTAGEQDDSDTFTDDELAELDDSKV